MLTSIENCLEDLFEQIEMMPQEKVEAAEKVNENVKGVFAWRLKNVLSVKWPDS